MQGIGKRKGEFINPLISSHITSHMCMLWVVLVVYALSMTTANGCTWQQISSPNAPVPRFDFGYTYSPASDIMYVFGGNTEKGEANDLYLFNFDEWQLQKLTTPPPPVRQDTSIIFHDNTLTIFGGVTNGTILDDIWCWHATDGWKQIGNSPKAQRMGYSIVQVNDHFVIFGGKTVDGITNDLISYYPSDNKFVDITPQGKVAPSPRYWTTVSYSNISRSLYVFGGYNDTHPSNDFWEFSFGTLQWKQIAETDVWPQARSGSMSVYNEKNGSIYLFGGEIQGGEGTNDLWVYEESQNAWQEILADVAPTKRLGHALVLRSLPNNQQKLAVFGGCMGWGTGDVALNDVWQVEQNC